METLTQDSIVRLIRSSSPTFFARTNKDSHTLRREPAVSVHQAQETLPSSGLSFARRQYQEKLAYAEK